MQIPEVYRIRISGLESGRIHLIWNNLDRIGIRFFLTFPHQNQDLQISYFGFDSNTITKLIFAKIGRMQYSSHQLQMCERGAVTPDVPCTAEHQSTTIASHQSTIRLNTTWCQIMFVNCELSRLEMWCCCVILWHYCASISVSAYYLSVRA